MDRLILYLTYDGLSDPLGQSQVLPYLISLADKGFRIYIISFEKPVNLTRREQSIRKDLESKGISWSYLTYTKYPLVISTIWDLLLLKRRVLKLCNSQDVGLIHCRSYLTSLIGLRMKIRKGIPFIFDMRGFWVDERVEGGLWNLKNPAYRIIYNFFKRQESILLRRADHVITLTHKAKKIILKWPNERLTDEISVIPTCADTKLFQPNRFDKAYTRTDLKISKSTFVLLYIGSVGTWYMLSEMITFFKTFLSKNDDSIFLIVTPDSNELIYDECSKQNVDSKKVIILKAERTGVPSLIALCNWSIFFIKPVFSKLGSMPTKFAEIASMDRPIICNNGVGDLEELFAKHSIGICLANFRKDTFELAIDKIIKYPNFVPTTKDLIDNFSLINGTSRLVNIYTYLLQSN